MTPGARIAAAIEVLDRVQAGAAAEQALTGWARGARYAGSKDRAAVRDHVFGVLRRMRSCAALGGGTQGRALMLGALRQDGQDPDLLFTGQGHAPRPLDAAERAAGTAPEGAAALDLPDWCVPHLRTALGTDLAAIAQRLRDRAPLHLRVNLATGDMAAATAALAADGIAVRPVPLCATALEVTEGARRVKQSAAYTKGLVEIQDAASQAVAARVPLRDGDRVLDYCAGGGGKSLALAARARIVAHAHDADAARLKDLPARAARAGADITLLHGAQIAEAAPFDVVVADVPCSGAGAWRRQPEAKWRLTPDGLARFAQVQDGILAECARLVAPGGHLVLITCSLFREENEDRAAHFLQVHPGWQQVDMCRLSPLEGGDGLFSATFARKG